ncbi:helix-turn-helix domain-containing protein [Sandaracinus amylolyticus]|uniref:Transcriptional regulator, AraC family protein n=1 Tax=Sandaracinus amylolyticus TaxID=927083 RepID=A0A0F6YLL1_9BACT|nr:helix-turn-helix domain-containing protein [Sandaracinus amylolyticus]AKF10007.1 Transcriptional regulator, AraC family protein [Sandaracinus amylolyticus]
MSARRQVRSSDSPFVERVTRVTYDAAVRELSTPDGTWDLVVIEREGRRLVLQTGLITRPVELENDAGDAYLAISFKPGVFLAKQPGVSTVDRGIVQPILSPRAFSMHGETLEIPTFDNADDFVARLARRDLLARDELVADAARGDVRAIGTRTLQRHFVHALGITPKQLAQIQRACRAVELLERGVAPAAVAIEVGYSDQPHMTRALKALVGRTPGQIRGG